MTKLAVSHNKITFCIVWSIASWIEDIEDNQYTVQFIIKDGNFPLNVLTIKNPLIPRDTLCKVLLQHFQ